jgi:hypothetical protein
MNTRTFGGGVFSDVCLLNGQGWLSLRAGDPRVAGQVVVYTWPGDVVQQAVALRQFPVPGESPSFTRLYAFGGAVWLFYHDGTIGHLYNLMTGLHQILTPCENNDPACFGAGYFAWQGAAAQSWPISRMSLSTGDVVPAGNGAGTGLSRVLSDGRVVLVDADRFALPGTTRPCFADGVAVGESQRPDNNGVVWDRAGVRGVLWPTQNGFTPRCATEGELTAVTAWGPDVRVWAGLKSELPAAPIDPEEPVDPVDPVDPETPVKLPNDVFATLQLIRPKYPTPLGDKGAELLNEVAWIHRAQGWGLESKVGGTVCPQPTTAKTCGCDILRTATLGWDVLGDAEGAGTPIQSDSGPAEPARFVAPVEPSDLPPDPASGELEDRVEALEASVKQLVENDEDIATDLNQLKAKVEHQGKVINDLTVRVLALENTPPGTVDLPADVVRVSTHEVKTPLTFSGTLTGKIQKKG